MEATAPLNLAQVRSWWEAGEGTEPGPLTKGIEPKQTRMMSRAETPFPTQG